MAVSQSFLVPALVVPVVDGTPVGERSHTAGLVALGFVVAVGLGGLLFEVWSSPTGEASSCSAL